MLKFNKMLSIILLSSCVSSLSFAAMVNSDVVKYIHTQTKSAFFAMCKSKLTGATDTVCSCLADSTVANIDDNSLMKCDSKDSNCIAKIVENAGIRAFSDDGIKACMSKSNSAAPQQPTSAS